MNNKRMPIFFVMFLFSMAGLWQFSKEVRSVDVVGLFASGILLGAAITGLLIMRIK
jgi:hypothetical protein